MQKGNEYQSFLLSKMYRKIYKVNSVTGILFNHESPLRDEKFVLKKVINQENKFLLIHGFTIHPQDLKLKVYLVQI